MTSIRKIALTCAALVAASGAFAQKAGDNIVGLGLAYISPRADLGTMTSSSPGDSNVTGTTFTGALNGASANVGPQTTVSLGLLHMYTDNIGGEFTIGIPAQFTQDLSSGGVNHSGAATMKIWTPTAVAKYFFATPQDKWRPYAGFGVSRVSFHNVTTLNDGVAGTLHMLAGTSADLSASWAPVYNLGAIYNIDDKWSINGSVSYIPAKTTATFVGQGDPRAATTVTTTGDVKMNTTDFVVRVGYRF
jgi:outer membrane protein